MKSARQEEKPILPPLDKKKFIYTLVLDLDETLVHFEASERKFRLRPGCLGFLRGLASHYEIVVFTAASQDYADFILNVLDPDGALIQHRLYR
jgi:CTD small phosphatase-like protein 2